MVSPRLLLADNVRTGFSNMRVSKIQNWISTGLRLMCDKRAKEKPPPRQTEVGASHVPRASYAAASSSFASVTSKLSPWESFSTSRPDSGMSPEVDCDTAIFLPMSRRQSICVVPA